MLLLFVLVILISLCGFMLILHISFKIYSWIFCLLLVTVDLFLLLTLKIGGCLSVFALLVFYLSSLSLFRIVRLVFVGIPGIQITPVNNFVLFFSKFNTSDFTLLSSCFDTSMVVMILVVFVLF